MSRQDISVDSDVPEDGKGQVCLSVKSAGRTEKSLCWYWILATALGMVSGGVSTAVVAKESTYATILWLMIAGTMIGTMQSLVLKRVISQTRQWVLTSIQWILASAIGWIVGWVITAVAIGAISLLLMIAGVGDYAVFYDVADSFLPTTLAVIFGAAGVSTLQQHILRARFNLAGRWTWMSVIGWCVGWVAALSVAYIIPGSEVMKGFAGGAIGGTVVGMITGIVLTRLLTSSRMKTVS